MKQLPILTGLIIGLLMNCSNEKSTPGVKEIGYNEKFRPQIHFTPPSNWMNDPNGLVYLDGEYHLFYQHYPDSNVWGPMHWGHAVSKDLVYWEQLPIALYPDANGLIFSGSAVVDYKNTSGFGKEGTPAMVAIFTQHSMEGEKGGSNTFQTQGIAYSLDKGRTWTMYDRNPVLPNPGKRDFRDPKVFWYEAGAKWIMTLAVGDHIEWYSSPDLKQWKFESEFGLGVGAHGGVWECPDLFQLPIPGTTIFKWVLLVSINPGAPNGGSGTQYFIGNFDGTHFTPDSKATLWLDYGKDNYAGVTWNDIPMADGRRLFIGWMSNWQYANIVPTTAWRSATTLPRELRLQTTNVGLRLASVPIVELDRLRTDTIQTTFAAPPEALPSGPLELNLDFIGTLDQPFELTFGTKTGEAIHIGGNKDTLYVQRNVGATNFSPDFGGRHFAVRSLNTTTWRIYLDAASIEVFADDNTAVLTEIFFLDEPITNLKLTKAGNIKHISMTAHPLRSIWNR